jgi:hypothetical protein
MSLHICVIQILSPSCNYSFLALLFSENSLQLLNSFRCFSHFIVLVKYLKPFYILDYSNKKSIRLNHLKMKVELGLDVVGLKLSEGEQLDHIFLTKASYNIKN